MKKIYSILAALVLTTGGLSSQAQAPSATASGPNSSGVITITYNSQYDAGMSSEADEETIKAYVENESQEKIYIPYSWSSENGYGTDNRISISQRIKVLVDLNGLLTKNGNYTLVIPAGFVTFFNDDDEEWISGNEFTYKFEWKLSSTEPDPTPGYEGITFTGPTPEKPNDLTISFDDIKAKNGYLALGSLQATLSKEGGSSINIAPTSFQGNYSTALSLNLFGFSLESGTYTLTLPKGFVTTYPGSASSEEMSFTFEYTVTEVKYDPQYSYNDNILDITWTNVTSLQAGNTTGAELYNTTTSQKVKDLTFNPGDKYTNNIRINSDGYTLRCNLDPTGGMELENGEYEIRIPAGYVKFNNTQTTNEAINYQFTVYIWTPGEVVFNGPENNAITATWQDATKVVKNSSFDSSYGAGVQIFSQEGDDDSSSIDVEDNDISFAGNVMTVSLENVTLPKGKCRLSINGEYVSVTRDDQTKNGQDVQYDFSNGTLDPTPTTPEVSEIEATWSGGDMASTTPLTVIWTGATISQNTENEESISAFGEIEGNVNLTFGTQVTISDNTLSIDLTSLKADTYRVNIPEGYLILTVDGKEYVNQGTSLDNVVIEEATPATTITLYVLNGSDDFEISNPWEKVTIWNQTAEEPVSCSGANFTFSFTEDTTLQISPEDMDEYELVVSAGEYNDAQYYTLEKETSSWILELKTGSEDLDFTIKVYQEGQAPKEDEDLIEVSFNISTEDSSITEPNKCLTLTYFDKTAFNEVTVDLTNTFASAEVEAGTTFTLTPGSGYVIKASTFSENVSISEPQSELEPWYISIETGAMSPYISIEVAKAPATATISFTSSSISSNPQNYVNVTPDNVKLTETSNTIVIPNDGLTFTVTPTTAYVEDGDEYVIASYQVLDSEGETLNADEYAANGVTISGTESEGWTVNLTKEADGVVIIFSVEDKDSSALNSFSQFGEETVIYNLQGVRVNNPAKGGLYIINGKKVLVK